MNSSGIRGSELSLSPEKIGGSSSRKPFSQNSRQCTTTYTHDPYSFFGPRIYTTWPDPEVRLTDVTLSILSSILEQPDDDAVCWTAGSASVVRLQCLVVAAEPDLYDEVVMKIFRGTFQSFLDSCTPVQYFFYDSTSLDRCAALGRLISQHEGRCSLKSKAEALRLDTAVALHWEEYFIPVELRDVAALVASRQKSPSDTSSLGCSQTTESEASASTRSFGRSMRENVAAVMEECETHHPFSRLISKNKLKEAVQSLLRGLYSSRRGCASEVLEAAAAAETKHLG
jgi:hypothetical protein